MNDIKDQVDVFNIFHDGSLYNLQLDQSTSILTVEIECEYIVELLIQGQDKLFVKFKNCKAIFFKHWDKAEVITDIEKIVQHDLEINSAVSTNDYLNITCLINSYSHSTGGNLYINAEEILLYDVNDNEVSVNRLRETAEEYWDGFKNRS